MMNHLFAPATLSGIFYVFIITNIKLTKITLKIPLMLGGVHTRTRTHSVMNPFELYALLLLCSRDGALPRQYLII